MLGSIVMLLAAGVLPPAGPVSLSGLCPKAKGDDIVVCADLDPKPSPYRAPLRLPPEFGTRASVSVSRERNALFDYDAGSAGNCSVVGGGGSVGCIARQHRRTSEQRAGAHDLRGRLYDEAGQ